MTAKPIRIVSYNVRYFGHALRGAGSTRRSKQGIARGLAALEPAPDVICLQEVETISLRSRWAHRTSRDGETQLEAFMEELELAFEERGDDLPYEALYFRAHTYRVSKLPIYTTGLAVLVNTDRFELDQLNGHAPVNITHHHVRRFAKGKQTRICAHVRLVDGAGRVLHVFNTHLSLPTPFAKAFWTEKLRMGFGANQLHEAHAVSRYVQECARGEPFVVCGDFNSPPTSPVYEHLTCEAGFHGAQAQLGQIDPAHHRDFPTAGVLSLRMHLDHLFFGGGLRCVDLDGTAPFDDRKSPFFRLSDHVPLIGRFALEGQKAKSQPDEAGSERAVSR